MVKNTPMTTNIQRFSPDITLGLNDIQVASRYESGLTNKVKQKYSKSYINILINNICTFFNLLGLLVFIAYILVRATISNYLFILFFATSIAEKRVAPDEIPTNTPSFLAISLPYSKASSSFISIISS